MVRKLSCLYILFSIVFFLLPEPLYAQDEDWDNLTYHQHKRKEKTSRDRSTYGFYLFGGVTVSAFVGGEVYDWAEDVSPLPGYTIGGGYDILRKKNGMYFGTELAFTLKGCSIDYKDRPNYNEKASSSNIILNYLQFTPMKVGWTFACSEKLNLGIYTGWGMDFMLGGIEKDKGYSQVKMRNRGWWSGDFDSFIPFNVNFDFKKMSVGMSYDLGIGNVVKSDVNREYDRIHNGTAAVKFIYHFQFKDRNLRMNDGKKQHDRYHREIFY